LAVRKEWGFARDIVEGIWALVSQDDVYEAVIGTGAPYTIERWAEECFRSVGLNYRDYTDERSEFVSEYLCLFSNPVTMARLGWSAKTSLQDLAELMVRAGDANA
jgi:GDPmannose 4,6-dehydratase